MLPQPQGDCIGNNPFLTIKVLQYPPFVTIQDMTFVVTDSCLKCKYTDCVEVCPVDCFYEGDEYLVIHPDECIDCALCVPECPVDAIVADDEVPPDQEVFTRINSELASTLPNINKTRAPLEDAERWKNTPNKLQQVPSLARYCSE